MSYRHVTDNKDMQFVRPGRKDRLITRCDNCLDAKGTL